MINSCKVVCFGDLKVACTTFKLDGCEYKYGVD